MTAVSMINDTLQKRPGGHGAQVKGLGGLR